MLDSKKEATNALKGNPAQPGKPDVSEDEEQAQPVSFLQLFQYADWYDKLLLISGAILSMANGVVMPLFSIVLGDLFDDFGQEAPDGDDKFYRHQAANSAKLFSYIMVFAFVASFAQMGFFTIAAERQTLRIREHYLSAILDQEIAWFDARVSGELTSRIAENTVIIKEAMGEKLGGLFQFGAMFVGGFVVGFYFSWKLTLVVCAMTPFLAIGGFMMMKVMSEMTSGGLAAYTKAGSVVEEALTNIRTVTAFNIQDQLLHKYETHLHKAESAGIKKSLHQGLGMGFVMFVMFCSYSLTFFYGSVLVKKNREQAFVDYPLESESCLALYETSLLSQADFCGSAYFYIAEEPCECGCSHPDAGCLTGGDVVLVFFSVLMGSFALGQAAPSLSALKNGQTAAGKIFTVIHRKPLILSNANNEKLLEDLTGKIVLKDIEFAYPTRKEVPIFRKMNLTIPSGKSTALVGGSGCGKSTALALIQRFYDPDGGQVLIDTTNNGLKALSDLHLESFRNQIGLVSQEPVLFATTIGKNISYGAKKGTNVTEEQMMAAAKAANAYDFIMDFPQKFDTMVGEHGAQLSGGQKQRIAIARALLRNPKFLLLDEATSALDNESEKIVQKALDELLEQHSRTTIVIAHRLSTIRNCDKIVVLGDGGVIEEGNHDQLMALPNGAYNMLVAAAERTQERSGNSDDINNLIETANEELAGNGGSAVRFLSSSMKARSVNSKSKVAASSKISLNEKPEERPKKKEELYKVSFFRILQLTKPEYAWYIPAVLSAAVNGAQMPVFAVLFAKISTVLYEADSDKMKDDAAVYAWGFFGLAVAIAVANFLQFYCFGFIAERLTFRVRLLLFHSMLKQNIAFFDDDNNSIGALTAGLSTDAALVKANIADRLSLAVMNLVTIVSGTVIAFIKGWQLTLILIAAFPLIAGAGALQMVAMASAAQMDDKHLRPANQILQESVAGIRTVTAFSSKDRVVKLYKEYLAVPMKLGTAKGVIIGLGFGFSNAVMFALYAGAFFVGAIFIDRGIFDFEQMLAVFFAVVMTAMSLGQSMALSPDVAKGSVAVSNVYKIVDRKSDIDPTSEAGQKSLPGDSYSVHFSKLEFAYPARPDAKVFNQFSLDVPGGATVALVGTSGSGKSTAIALLERFYDPAMGGITICNGQKLNDLNVKWWREQIGLVEQEPKLFATTIRDNILYGLPAGTTDTEAAIVDAAKAANAHDFIMGFPAGYDTMVGDQGAQLSGGQKQRICIARAIIKKPKILLLDEATSALDNTSEKIVQAALDKLLLENSMTTIVVAHRLTTIKDANIIVVMAHGAIAEIGTHASLLEQKGTYSKLWNSQNKNEK